MIVIKLQGGMGNQLFQFAAYSKLLEKGKVVYLDVSEYNLPQNNCYRKYLLNELKITPKLSLCVFSDSLKTRIKHFLYKDNIKVFTKETYDKLTKIDVHDGTEISEDMNEIHDNSYVLGYFTNKKFFNNSINNFHIAFFNNTINNVQTIYNEIKNNHSISVHIRRTDYLNESTLKEYGNICTYEYYNKAISYFQNLDSKSIFYFFSDDIDWVKKEFGNKYNYVFVEHNTFDDSTISDLFLMSSCKNNIIANSTYSWWAAYLNSNTSKIVIRPQKYQNTKNIDIFCKSWLNIEEI